MLTLDVGLEVAVERRLDGERPVALAAPERLLAGVRAQMAQQVTRLLERLGAVRTRVGVAPGLTASRHFNPLPSWGGGA